MAEEKYTSIRIQTSTAEQLKMMGRKGESYDDIISWLLKNSRKRKSLKISNEVREMRGLK
jgi:predicted CopG family antitoxin